MKIIREKEHISYEEKLRVVVFSTWRKLWGHHIVSFQHIKAA